MQRKGYKNLNNEMANFVKNVFPLVLQKFPLIFYGQPGNKKSFCIQMLAFLYAKSQGN